MTTPESQQTVNRPSRELFGQRRGYGFAGLGVHTATGNHTQRSTDLSFPQSLFGLLDWTRTYNSLSTENGPLGRGWVTAFSAHLDEVANGQRAELHDETGRVLTFARVRPGEYRRSPDLDADLRRSDDGDWTLRFNTGVRWLFDEAGRLTAREYEGQRVTVTQSPEGRPTQATHTSGRGLTMSYTDGRLVSVRADDGRTIRYTHNAQGNLETVTGPEDATTTRYAYTDGTARLSQVTDPDGVVVVVNSYDNAGRVVQQRYPTGSRTEFAYDTSANVTTVTSMRRRNWWEPDGKPCRSNSTGASGRSGRDSR